MKRQKPPEDVILMHRQAPAEEFRAIDSDPAHSEIAFRQESAVPEQGSPPLDIIASLQLARSNMLEAMIPLRHPSLREQEAGSVEGMTALQILAEEMYKAEQEVMDAQAPISQNSIFTLVFAHRAVRDDAAKAPARPSSEENAQFAQHFHTRRWLDFADAEKERMAQLIGRMKEQPKAFQAHPGFKKLRSALRAYDELLALTRLHLQALPSASIENDEGTIQPEDMLRLMLTSAQAELATNMHASPQPEGEQPLFADSMGPIIGQVRVLHPDKVVPLGLGLEETETSDPEPLAPVPALNRMWNACLDAADAFIDTANRRIEQAAGFGLPQRVERAQQFVTRLEQVLEKRYQHEQTLGQQQSAETVAVAYATLGDANAIRGQRPAETGSAFASQIWLNKQFAGGTAAAGLPPAAKRAETIRRKKESEPYVHSLWQRMGETNDLKALTQSQQLEERALAKRAVARAAHVDYLQKSLKGWNNPLLASPALKEMVLAFATYRAMVKELTPSLPLGRPDNGHTHA